MLGQMYRDGRGTKQDYVAAYKWFILAKAGGNEIDGTVFLGPKMSPEDIAQAEMQASEWLRAHPSRQ
jgi:hypothetical protein